MENNNVNENVKMVNDFDDYDEWMDQENNGIDAYAQAFIDLYGSANIEELEVKPSEIIIKHEPIENLNMAEMTYIDEQKVGNQ